MSYFDRYVKTLPREIFKLKAEMRTNRNIMQYNHVIHLINQIIKYLIFEGEGAFTEYDKSGSWSVTALDSKTY